MKERPAQAQGKSSNHESIHLMDPKAIPIVGSHILVDLTKQDTILVNIEKAPSWDVITGRASVDGNFMEGLQAKSSDAKNQGEQISGDVLFTLSEMRKEIQKVSTPEHKAFIAKAGANDAITIFVTNKPFEKFSDHKRKLEAGEDQEWPRKVLLVCNENMSTALPSALANYGIFQIPTKPTW